MFKLAIASLLVAATLAELPKPDFGLLSDEEIHYINNVAKTTWTAGRNFHPSDHAHVLRILGVPDMERAEYLARQLPRQEFSDSLSAEDLPESFDPRDKWPNCSSLNEIRDQGNCGSCWAFGAVEVMTDRICIASQGKLNFHFSAEDLMTCCSDCGNGCHGGTPAGAWDFFNDEGIVSGGPWNSSQGCQPYKIKACDHHVTGKLRPCAKKIHPTPLCKRRCRQGYSSSYRNDKRYGKSAYRVDEVKDIMRELVTNGPVEAAFTVYSDFLHYKSGVYRYTSGSEHGGHAVKIIGYGVENGTKYWLVANSWNPDWGDKGFFKILRGENECDIESQVVTGKPKL